MVTGSRESFLIANIFTSRLLIHLGKLSDMRLPIQFATSLRQRILDAGLLTEVELDEALSACEEIARNPETFVMSFIVTQVWGRKRAD
jgi:hypothetical protein